MKKLVRIICITAFVIIGVSGLLLMLHPRIPLGIFSGTVSSLLTHLSGSDKVISGEYFLIPGTWTTFEVENGSVELTGKEGFRLKAWISSARTTVHIWSLVAKEIRLDGISVHGLNLFYRPGKTKDTSASMAGGRDKNELDLILANLQETGSVDLSDINVAVAMPESEKPLKFQLIEGRGAFSNEVPSSFAVQAVWNGMDFKAYLDAGPLPDMSDPGDEWPYTIQMNHKSIDAKIIGFVREMDKSPHILADISLSCDHFDDLVSIIGLHGSRDKHFSLQGTASLSNDEIRGEFFTMRTGDEITNFSFTIEKWITEDPEYTLVLKNESLNLDALKNFLAGGEQKTIAPEVSANKTQISRDDVLFPAAFPLRNLVLDLDLGELVMAGRKAKDIRLKAVMVDGIVKEAPYAVTFGNGDLSGYFSLDIAGRVPRVAVHNKTSFFDIGAFLQEFKLADEIHMRIENAATDLNTSGRTLGELFNNFEFTVTAADGEFDYHDPNTNAVLPVILTDVEITGVQGEKIAVAVKGKIDDTPVAILTEIDDRRDEPPGSVKEVSVTQQIQIADVTWQLSGRIPLPFRMEGIDMQSTLAGERLSNLNELLHLDLPGLGPYEAKGSVSINSQGYTCKGIQVQVGSSLLEGDITLSTDTSPPELHVGLNARRIRLDDFKALRLLSGKGADNGGPIEEEMKTGMEKKKGTLTDQAILDMYNATVRIEVGEVLSGADHLGSGTLNIVQKNGRFQVDPLQINTPGGTANVYFSVSPADQGRFYTMNMFLEEFDYGSVARWFKPDTDMSGIINLRASMESISPDRQGIMANGSGYLTFSIQPRQMRAGVIDLWAVNLFNYLIPYLTPKGESKINCAAGRFKMEQGILEEEEFLIDTSKIRVKGTVTVDFKKNKINARLRPIPKRPQFYSLSIPLEIEGNLSDLEAGLAPGGVIGTMVRLATSYIVVPLQWIIQNRLPEDDTEACLQLVEEKADQGKSDESRQ